MKSAFDFIPVGEHADIAARTSTFDASDDLQEWLDFCRSNRVKGLLPAGTYRITKSLFLTRDAFSTCHIEGEGLGSGSDSSKSEIHAEQLDTPALCVQYGRGVRIAHLAISGGNTAAEFVAPASSDQSDYLSAGVRASRYSPHCGICVDPAIGPIPPDGGYPGFEYKNAVGGTAFLTIDSVYIRGFAVGIMLSPDGSSQQGDNIRIDKCHMVGNDTHIAIGQDQNKNVVINQCQLMKGRVVVSNTLYGKQTGTPPILRDSQIVEAYSILEMHSTRGSMAVSGCYAEGLCTIGMWGVGWASTRYPLLISGCNLHLERTLQGRPAPYILEAHAPVKIQACMLLDVNRQMKVMNFVGGAHIDFDTCSFMADWIVDFAPIGNNLFGTTAKFSNSEIAGDSQTALYLDDQVTDTNSLGLGNVSNVTFTGTQIEFITSSFSEINVDDLFGWRILPQLGSFASHIAPSLRCVSVVDDRIICDMLFNSQVYDTSFAEPFLLQEPLRKAN